MNDHQSIVTGVPDYAGASEVAKSLLELPAGVDEEEIRSRTREILGRLFPKLKYPEIASQFNTGDGPADVVCRNLVVEAKGEGKMHAVRRHPDGSLETPEEQLERYLTAMRQEPDLFYDPIDGWRGVVTDGKKWDFYRFDPDVEPRERLIPDGTLQLVRESDIGPLLFRLHDAIDKVSKIAPPTHDDAWAKSKVKGFADLAYDVRIADSFQMKMTLWRDMLQGAFITAPTEDADEIQLFASHTMLVLIARAVSDAIRPPHETSQHDGRLEGLTRGFAAWLIDVGGEDGRNLVEDLVADVDRYEWRRSERDNLKDLYHAVIPRDIRHDFGEYYTPDWLARAVCEEVLDADWRNEVVQEWVTGRRSSPAVLDPSCGSGTFLYHATQLLLETAAEHPDLADSPIAQVEAANALVAGMDLHPVAVELAKTTKALAFAGKGVVLLPDDDPNVFLGDSLQWSLKTNRVTGFDENVVEIPTADGDDPIRLPRSLVLSDRFSQYLREMFDLANMEDSGRAEEVLLTVLDLRSKFERETVLKEFRRFQDYKRTGRNHVWHWYIANLVQPLRLGEKPMTRLIGNPPWVVYNSMVETRQDNLRGYAMDRQLWATARLAPHNDLAATFVATCVDEYLAGGGKFGFVMPYAMLKASQWDPFRSGDWTSQASPEATKVDMSEPAWDMTGIHAPPFAHVQSSVVFGTKIELDNGNKSGVPLKSMLRPVGNGVDSSMGWCEVASLLEWKHATEWPGESSEAYVGKFRLGASLVPQSLVVFDEESQRRNTVQFTTEPGKGVWASLSRPGVVEPRFVLKAVFSKHLVPFGHTGTLNIIAPVSEDGKQLLTEMPGGPDGESFRLYWQRADTDYRAHRRPKSPPDLLSRIDHRRALSNRLVAIDSPCVVYRKSGGRLSSAVVPGGLVVDNSLYWMSSDDEDELHFLCAIFNAPALAQFFHEKARSSGRDFHTGPIRLLPIPEFDGADERHAALVHASRLAHCRVVSMGDASRRDVLDDWEVRDHALAIDDIVRAMFPDYCSTVSVV